MDEAFIGSVVLFAGNFVPRNWAFCNGQLLSIAQNTALFSILGTTYGGNGQTTFGLPDLRSRVPVGTGNGAGLSNIRLGEMGGVESVTLTVNQMPSHTHPVLATTNGTGGTGNVVSAANGTATTTAFSNPAGGSQPHENRSPYLGLNYIICLYGIYPSRD